jgi:magnesium chelatase family protein
VKRALEVSAAGGHNRYLVGVAGAGKSMLPGLLPAPEDDVALEVTAVHSVAGVLPPTLGLFDVHRGKLCITPPPRPH